METVWIVIGIVVVLLILAAFAAPGKCSICGLPLKRKYYNWTIRGQKQTLCPKCNGQMERKISREAFKQKFG